VKVGLSATAEITTATRESTLVIPIQAVAIREEPGEKTDAASTDSAAGGPGADTGSTARGAAAAGERPERKGVFLVKEGEAEFTPVETGITGGMNVEVLEGLDAGDEIVIGSYRVLRTLESGTRIRVDNEADTGGEEE